MTRPQIRARFDDLTGAGSAFELRNPTAELTASNHEEVAGVATAAEHAARSGAWVAGFVAYEAAPAFDPALEVRSPEGGLPLAWFGVFEDRVPVPTIRAAASETSPWRLDWTAQRHASAVAEIKELLAAGETYQVNLTVRARRAVADPAALYAGMALAQGGAYNAYLETSTLAVACASPELFFEQTGERLVTRPMKGTRPRGRFPAEDAAQARALLSSAKDRAEHVMIVDLVRNDLGRVAVPGSVRVGDLATIERYHTVWQLTSTIGATPRPTVSLVDIFAALFPSGSVTGAPKPATMEIIADLEGRPRGVYCGAVGYLAPSGEDVGARFAVAIRTATVDRMTGMAQYGTGGGITWSSDPSGEWQELRDKCAILDPPTRPPALFETLRLDPQHGPVNLERHLDRLESSARFFAVPFRRRDAEEQVRVATAESQTAGAGAAPGFPRRLRVSLADDGELAISLGDFPSSAPGPVRLGVAMEPVDSQDQGLFFKSTDRRRYDQARARRPDVDDVVLYNERGEVTETTIANLAVRGDGRWWTPSLGCGLLPGVERRRLIDSGELAERVITLDELRAASELAVINSLRGWRTAILVDRLVGAADHAGGGAEPTRRG